VQLHRLWIQEFCAGAEESVLDILSPTLLHILCGREECLTINCDCDSERSQESLQFGPTIAWMICLPTCTATIRLHIYASRLDLLTSVVYLELPNF
jgi:hypothetical protein